MEELQTPCFVLDEEGFINNLCNFQRVLKQYFRKAVLGYSFKTNSLPRLLSIALEKGCYAEVVSEDEYRLAERIGYPANRIIFNGPIKPKKLLFYALEEGSMVNVDSNREIEWLYKHNFKSPVSIGIRVNIDLEDALPEESLTGTLGGRFGFSEKTGALHNVINRLKDNKNVNVVGLHLHTGSKTKSVRVYEVLVNEACRIAKAEKLNLSYIDIGGGFFGGGDSGQAYDAYIAAIHRILEENEMEQIELIVEPGASVVATAFSYCTKVIDVKDTNYGRYVVTDGTRLHIDPFMAKSQYRYETVASGTSVLPKQTICGYTCMEKDRIMDIIEELELQVGDGIRYQIVGSYTLCLNASFISFLPRVYAMRGGKYTLAREKWGVEEYLQGSWW